MEVTFQLKHLNNFLWIIIIEKVFIQLFYKLLLILLENLLIFLLDILVQLMIVEYFIILHYIICLTLLLQLFLQNAYILGDASYPCQNWILTPYRDNGRLTQIQ